MSWFSSGPRPLMEGFMNAPLVIIMLPLEGLITLWLIQSITWTNRSLKHLILIIFIYKCTEQEEIPMERTGKEVTLLRYASLLPIPSSTRTLGPLSMKLAMGLLYLNTNLHGLDMKSTLSLHLMESTLRYTVAFQGQH